MEIPKAPLATAVAAGFASELFGNNVSGQAANRNGRALGTCSAMQMRMVRSVVHG